MKICIKCGGELKPSKAFLDTFTVSDDFGRDKGGIGTTSSQNGPAKLVNCLKCNKCGHSIK